jgi:uncharacterized protein YjbJ (UPF0337 family)
MINEQVLKGKWQEVRGQLRKRWGKLSEDDVRTFDGSVEQLIGRLQNKTGEAREVIERFLGRMTDEGMGVASQVHDTVKASGERAAKAMQDGYAALRDGYEEAETFVHERPATSVAVAFGIGVASGLAVALLLHQPKHESRVLQGRAAAERLGKQILDGLAGMLPESLAKTLHG